MSMVDLTQSLMQFRLPPIYRDKLIQSGFTILQDLEGLGPVELSKQCTGLSVKDASNILKTIENQLNGRNQSTEFETAAQSPETVGSLNADSSSFPIVSDTDTMQLHRKINIFDTGMSALEKMSHEALLPPIVTFCEHLDDILGGGVQLGKITEFCGLPGVGKTQLGIQIAVNAFIPFEFGGCAGNAIYIDTEGSFIPNRAMEMAQELVNHINSLNDENVADNSEPQKPVLTSEYIAQNIHYFRVHNYIEQLSIIGQLHDIVKQLNDQIRDQHGMDKVDEIRPQIRCVILDSVTFHFRATDQFTDLGVRSRLLTKMASELAALAKNFNLAVVIMNQMTTKPGIGVVPALGDAWGHQGNTRVVLEADPVKEMRKAILVKSSSNSPATAFYQITREGVRSCATSE